MPGCPGILKCGTRHHKLAYWIVEAAVWNPACKALILTEL